MKSCPQWRSTTNSFRRTGRTESVTGWWGRSRRFLAEVRNEMGRVTWPSRKEVYATTLVVILTSIVLRRRTCAAST